MAVALGIRLGAWLIVITLTALAATVIAHRISTHLWLPKAIAMNAIRPCDCPSPVMELAVASGGNRRAIDRAATSLLSDGEYRGSVRHLMLASARLDELAAPTPPGAPRTAAIGLLAISTFIAAGVVATGSPSGLVLLITFVSAATVTWSRWDLEHRQRPDLLATIAAHPSVTNRERAVEIRRLALLAQVPRLVTTASIRVIEQTDLPADEHRRVIDRVRVATGSLPRRPWLTPAITWSTTVATVALTFAV
ncbi:hypothetical protein [Ilumatobacter sp.]|uniref:hypothetical protein n=1 Tax=Ilumatobacter sp. TaxID=1967498 RepID=UPI003C3AB80B